MLQDFNAHCFNYFVQCLCMHNIGFATCTLLVVELNK